MSSTPSQSKLRIASHGKRLFALIVDFVFVLLLVNTINHLRYPVHWDLTAASTSTWRHLIPIYLAFFALVLFKDSWRGTSPGKFIFGITTRQLDDLSQSPALGKGILRNLSLGILPIEGILLLMDSHGRRLGDRWVRTVVIEHPAPPRIIIRVMVANTIFFAYFFGSFLISPLILTKTAAYQSAITHIQNTPEALQILGDIEDFESPEMDINIQEKAGQAIVLVTAIGTQQTLPVTVHLKLVTDPQRSWEPERMTIGPSE